jgi:hypothetical protein
MTKSLPIACSLDAAALSGRLDEIAALGRDALIDVDRAPERAVLRFVADATVRDRVVAIADAESRCCGFLTLRVSDEPEAIVLTIDAPADAELVLDELVGAFHAKRGAA